MNRNEAETSDNEERRRVERLAIHILGGDDISNRWMNAPCKALDGLAPTEALKDTEGVKAVEELLYRIDAGFSA
ncbi:MULTISPECIES: MbcA/ParS/Xre antitoxin family protein [unclassified Marinimicrobium]|jgi:uncharacterized protein (DUF2384 family)|uniref:MbcA/ParS/Xre antitoxin family protein n=1 Tax=Marinimicrobium TaxID=359337 RepID=UPI000C6771B3|nr:MULTISPECIES: MbcA/ParS/Xre antitoxin family protein [unclassified Marinimicrobium]MAN51321.1 hypothetical protein [Marinimicrobium sp.]|tara:strand:- start:770 stop:991 length:222 start_codon:yes stop_codon:yes gene_type:complete